MYVQTRDEEVLKQFWIDETTNTPRHFQDGINAWRTSWEDFKGFCDNAERIYLIDNSALLYVERIDDKANIHFSLLRGKKVDIADLISIRDELLKDCICIFGYAGKHSWGLKRLLRECGLEHHGVEMLKGRYKNRVMTWQLFLCERTAMC